MEYNRLYLSSKRNYFLKVYIMANYIVLGTWNTKYEELDFLCEEIRRRSHQPIPLDLSTKKTTRHQEYCGPSIHFEGEGQIERNSKKEAYLRCHFSGWRNKSFHGDKIDGRYSSICSKDHRFNDDCQQYPQFQTL